MAHHGLKIVLAGLVVGGGILGYKYLLAPGLKATLKDTVSKSVQLGKDIQETIATREAKEEEERVKANRDFVAEQWRAAGF